MVNVEDPDAFIERMNVAIIRAGGVGALAEKASLSRAVIEKYRRGQSDPSRLRLIAMANAADVALEWLATGSGPLTRDKERPEFDEERLRKTIISLEKEFRSFIGKPDPEEWADFIIHAYSMGRGTKA